MTYVSKAMEDYMSELRKKNAELEELLKSACNSTKTMIESESLFACELCKNMNKFEIDCENS